MMRAAWYEKNGAAEEVMIVGDLPDPVPAAGEVRVRLHASAVNPSDVKARGGSRPIRWPKLIPNSDGAGVIDKVGAGVNRRIGEHVWVFNGQWDRAFGTSAQMIALPAVLAVPLPGHVSFEQGACLGISDAVKAQAHADIARWLREIKPLFAIAQRFPLAEVVQAHQAVERGEKIGHVILTID